MEEALDKLKELQKELCEYIPGFEATTMYAKLEESISTIEDISISIMVNMYLAYLEDK